MLSDFSVLGVRRRKAMVLLPVMETLSIFIAKQLIVLYLTQVSKLTWNT